MQGWGTASQTFNNDVINSAGRTQWTASPNDSLHLSEQTILMWNHSFKLNMFKCSVGVWSWGTDPMKKTVWFIQLITWAQHHPLMEQSAVPPTAYRSHDWKSQAGSVSVQLHNWVWVTGISPHDGFTMTGSSAKHHKDHDMFGQFPILKYSGPNILY